MARSTIEDIEALVNDLRTAKERLDSGILTDKEVFEELLDKLLYEVEL
jgi:hypothetical protein